MAKVHFSETLEKLSLDFSVFRNKKVLVKLHMGEEGNKYHLKASLVRKIIKKLKESGARPFLFDSVTLYPGSRYTKRSYLKTADSHGFTEEKIGCPVVIGDEGVKTGNLEICEEVADSKYMLILSHVKGHDDAGFGGAVKNLGMGCVSSETKAWLHSGGRPVIDRKKCTLCGKCADVCPFSVIEVKKEWLFDEGACFGCGRCVRVCPQKALTYKIASLGRLLAKAALAAIKGKKVLYINVLKNISKHCDCLRDSGPIICKDIGFLSSDDLFAIDAASIDLVEEKMGKSFFDIHGVEPREQLARESLK